MTETLAELEQTAAAVAALGRSRADIGLLDDDSLLVGQSLLTEHRRQFDLYAAWYAAEIAARSARDRGHSGIAQQRGFRSPEEFLQNLTGATKAEATRLVAVSTLLDSTPESVEGSATSRVDAPAADPVLPEWQREVALAIRSQRISIDAGDAIRAGLSVLADHTDSEALAVACRELIALAARGASVEQLRCDALHTRARLDAEGVAAREAEAHAQRRLRVRWNPDGSCDGGFHLAAEDATTLRGVLDVATNPRRSGPQFVETDGGAGGGGTGAGAGAGAGSDARATAAGTISDDRTTEQRAVDALMDVLRSGLSVDSDAVPVPRASGVRVIVTDHALQTRTGSAQIEGTSGFVAVATVDRLVCTDGFRRMLVDSSGQVLDRGREKRIFTAAQRDALGARDGGCIAPGCGRPPSQCEAHHINQWRRDGGKTDVRDGVLLCRFHHLMFHNNGWEIFREGGRYWLRPPRSVDAHQEPILILSNNRAIRELQSA